VGDSAITIDVDTATLPNEKMAASAWVYVKNSGGVGATVTVTDDVTDVVLKPSGDYTFDVADQRALLAIKFQRDSAGGDTRLWMEWVDDQ
jgi:hypothetical protein